MRHDLDRYDSPTWFLTAVLPYIAISGSVFECCAGGEILASELRKIPSVTRVLTGDIDKSLDVDIYLDATSPMHWLTVPCVDWIITNPPYGGDSAFKILQNAYHQASNGVILFMRVTWEEPCNGRAQWLFENPYTMKITLPRFSFRRGKNGNWSTDACTIAAYIWEFDDDNLGAEHRKTKLKRSLSIPREHIKDFYSNPGGETK